MNRFSLLSAHSFGWPWNQLEVAAGRRPPVSRQNVQHDIPVNIGQAEVAVLEFVGELGVVDAEAPEQRGVNIVDVHRVPGDAVTEIVR